MPGHVRDYEKNGRKSISHIKNRWRHLSEVFGGNFRAAGLESGHIDDYILLRRKQNAKPATCNRELALLKRAFYLGAKAKPQKVKTFPVIKLLPENKPTNTTGWLVNAVVLACGCGHFFRSVSISAGDRRRS
jgi:hypothetical protein